MNSSPTTTAGEPQQRQPASPLAAVDAEVRVKRNSDRVVTGPAAGTVRLHNGEAMHRERDAVVRADPSMRILYRIGGISAGLFVALLLVATTLAITTPPPPTVGGAATMQYIASHRTLYILHQQLWLVPGVFAAVMYLALYPALKPAHASFAALGCAVGGIAWALTLAMPTTSTGAPALVYLSDQYAATTDPAQRIALVGAAESLIAINRTPTVVGVLTTVGMLIVSLVMLRGIFPRWIAYLGIATGLLGIGSEALRPVIENGYAVYGLLMLVWMGAVGVRLYHLGATSAARDVPESQQASHASQDHASEVLR